MANIQQRSGEVLVRVGGNAQDTAVLVFSMPDGVTDPVCYYFLPTIVQQLSNKRNLIRYLRLTLPF
jgi:hypothetical protein